MLDGIALTGDKFVDEFNQNRFSFTPLKIMKESISVTELYLGITIL
jgi:hypothetical protein